MKSGKDISSLNMPNEPLFLFIQLMVLPFRNITVTPSNFYTAVFREQNATASLLRRKRHHLPSMTTLPMVTSYTWSSAWTFDELKDNDVIRQRYKRQQKQLNSQSSSKLHMPNKLLFLFVQLSKKRDDYPYRSDNHCLLLLSCTNLLLL